MPSSFSACPVSVSRNSRKTRGFLSVLHELECDAALAVTSDASIDVLPRHLHIALPHVIFKGLKQVMV
jgi:hypothetical protein